MGNTQTRKRMSAKDFGYIAKNTAFLTNDIVEEYYRKISTECSDGKMEPADFQHIFKTAFPERPQDKLEKLAAEITNKNGKIDVVSLLMLIYLFSEGSIDAKLGQIFNLFDQDGNGNISVDELLNLMAFFIEIGEGKNHKVDLATTMAEMYNLGDSDKNEKLEKAEFIRGMKGHPVTNKILQLNKIDALLEIM
ncbi:calcium-binding protein M [Eurytemora carolleeae]|uniref:calcium-binding protein M n=1 Tax=Eurytemora carolleeae TaxID=1294199 RepID=UPI000C75C05D|nr:calcium-binding protein M [Eurytemora carolleeae]|eukprot:XP_023345288.1 calcium-binding protein M-like [Eurytemora affinis]